MLLDLRKLFLSEGESLPVSCEFDFSDVECFGGYPLKQPVKAEGIIENRAGVVGVRLVCRAEYTAPCDRCTALCTETVTVPIDRVLVTERESDDDDELIILNDYKLDVQGLCYDEVIPNLPSKHLCRQDCKGVCPECGKDLNEGDCGCATKAVDPRLAKLSALLDNDDQN